MKINRRLTGMCSLACAWHLAMTLGCSTTPGHPTSPQAEQTVRLPGIAVSQSAAEVRVDGQVCIEHGMLEYLAVAGGGKEYESLFSLDCRPSHLQVAMLIAGCQAGEVDPTARGDFAGGRDPSTDPAANPRPANAPQVTSPSKDYWTSRTGQPTRITIDVEVRQVDRTWKQRSIESFVSPGRREGDDRGGFGRLFQWVPVPGAFLCPRRQEKVLGSAACG